MWLVNLRVTLPRVTFAEVYNYLVYDFPTCKKYATYAAAMIMSGYFGTTSSGSSVFTLTPETDKLKVTTNITGVSLYGYCAHVAAAATSVDSLFAQYRCDPSISPCCGKSGVVPSSTQCPTITSAQCKARQSCVLKEDDLCAGKYAASGSCPTDCTLSVTDPYYVNNAIYPLLGFPQNYKRW